MNAGSIISLERTAPPGSASASSTTTVQPRSASTLAATRPLGPAPMTTASTMVGGATDDGGTLPRGARCSPSAADAVDLGQRFRPHDRGPIDDDDAELVG